MSTEVFVRDVDPEHEEPGSSTVVVAPSYASDAVKTLFVTRATDPITGAEEERNRKQRWCESVFCPANSGDKSAQCNLKSEKLEVYAEIYGDGYCIINHDGYSQEITLTEGTVLDLKNIGLPGFLLDYSSPPQGLKLSTTDPTASITAFGQTHVERVRWDLKED